MESLQFRIEMRQRQEFRFYTPSGFEKLVSLSVDDKLSEAPMTLVPVALWVQGFCDLFPKVLEDSVRVGRVASNYHQVHHTSKARLKQLQEMRLFRLPADDQDFCDARKELYEMSSMTRWPYEGVLVFVLEWDGDDGEGGSAAGELRPNAGDCDELARKSDGICPFDKVLRKKSRVGIQVYEPGPVDGAVRFEEPKAQVCEVIALEILRSKTKGGECAVEEEVIVECDQTDWFAAFVEAQNPINEWSIVRDAARFVAPLV